ncbi:MAG: hypothetical protein ACOY4I_04885 [Bacillota bacterium]
MKKKKEQKIPKSPYPPSLMVVEPTVQYVKGGEINPGQSEEFTGKYKG